MLSGGTKLGLEGGAYNSYDASLKWDYGRL